MSIRKMGVLPGSIIRSENPSAIVDTNSADELPQQLHDWCKKMNLLPPHDLPSAEDLSALCRGVAHPALSYIIRHYQPRDRILAFRRSQAAAAEAAAAKANRLEKSRLVKQLLEKDKEVERWKAEVASLEKQLKDTSRAARASLTKAGQHEDRTRLLMAKAGELHMRQRSAEMIAERLSGLSTYQPADSPENLTEEKMMAVVADLQAAGSAENAVAAVAREISCSELRASLQHAQLRLLRKAQSLEAEPEDSAGKQVSALHSELFRIATQIQTLRLEDRQVEDKIDKLQEEQAELEQACVAAALVHSSPQLVDTGAPSDAVLRRVQAQATAAANAVFVRLAPLQPADGGRAEPVGVGMGRARDLMLSQLTIVKESLEALANSEAGAEARHAQALAALAHSSLPADAAQARALLDALACASDGESFESAEGGAPTPTLLEQTFEAEELTTAQRKASNYLAALQSISFPEPEELDERHVDALAARQADLSAAAALHLGKLADDLESTAGEIEAVVEAATFYREHPVQRLVPADAAVAGKTYEQWYQRCKAAVNPE